MFSPLHYKAIKPSVLFTIIPLTITFTAIAQPSRPNDQNNTEPKKAGYTEHFSKWIGGVAGGAELALHTAIFYATYQIYNKVPQGSILDGVSKIDLGSPGLIKNNVLAAYLLHSALPLSNNYLCGSIAVSMNEGWYIQSIDLKHGSLQNTFMFNKLSDTIYSPKYPTNITIIKQDTHWRVSDISLQTIPLEFNLTITNGDHTSTFYVKKDACTNYNLGKALVKLEYGENLPFMLKNSQANPESYTLSSILTSAFASPAMLIIPSNQQID